MAKRAGSCSHLGMIREVKPATPEGCGECLRSGGKWVHLRLCLSCGAVGCCNESPNKHAAKHAAEAKHPLVRSFELGEDWVWCYVDEQYVSRALIREALGAEPPHGAL